MHRSLQRMLVRRGATLLDAMRAIAAGGQAISFVTDADGRVLGTITDGDVRRSILAGSSLSSRCLGRTMQRNFVAVGPRAHRAEVLDMMRARGITQVPVLDEQSRLRGLHLLHDLVGGHERPNWALVMAGGKGERLRPLTLKVPKPMIPVAGRPILERLVLHLVGAGIRRVFLSVNYLADVIERHFGDGSRFGCAIEYLHEDRPLGTGGPLALLPKPTHPVVLLNGDLITQVDVADLLRFHEAGAYAISLGTRSHEVSVPFGVVDVKGARVVDLREKPAERVLINAGVYALSPRAVHMVPEGRLYPITDLVANCLRRRMRVGAYYIEADWQDIGRPEELQRARGEL